MADFSCKAGFIIFLVIGVSIAIIVLVSVSLEKLASDEVGMKYNKVLKGLGDTPVYEGLHSGPPGFDFIVFPSVFRTFEFSKMKCLNRDGVESLLSISYQYRVRPNRLHDIILQFKDHEGYKSMLYTIGESALHESCSRFNTSQFQAERGAFQEDVRQRLVSKYDKVDGDVTDLQVINIQRPGAYEEAVKSKEEAREDISVADNERPRQLTQAATEKKKAQAQAQITINKAESDARIIVNRAKAEAEAILNDFKREAEAYKSLINASGLNLSAEGFLSYLRVRTIEDAKRPVFINMKGPGETN